MKSNLKMKVSCICSFTPKLYKLVMDMLSFLLSEMNVSLKTGRMHRLQDFCVFVERLIANEKYKAEFRARFSQEEQAENIALIDKIWMHFVKSLSNKFIWSMLKQQDWAKQDMSIRDKFKFAHMEHTRRLLQAEKERSST